MFLPRLIHYTSPLDEWQVIVTMATGLSLIGRVDTKVRNKALLAPWGCRAFEQVSAMLLAGCPGKKDVKKDVAADTELAKSDVIQTGHIWFFQLAVCFWVLGPPLFLESFREQTEKVSTIPQLILGPLAILGTKYPGLCMVYVYLHLGADLG